jgi:hypothetical protein
MGKYMIQTGAVEVLRQALQLLRIIDSSGVKVLPITVH